jgi:hypothetical protein
VGAVLTKIAVTTAKWAVAAAVRYGLSIVGGNMLPVMCGAILCGCDEAAGNSLKGAKK